MRSPLVMVLLGFALLGCDGLISGGPPAESSPKSACDGTTHGTTAKMRLLWQSAYLAELTRTLGAPAATAAASVGLSPATDKFFTFETTGSLLTDAALASLADTADAVAVQALSSDARAQEVFGCNARSVSGTAAEQCFEQFLRGTGAKLLRRPLTDAEVSDTLDFFRTQAALGESDGTREGFRQGLASLLVHPDFLWLRDVPQAQGEALTAASLASRVSFSLTGHGPDDELFSHVLDGTLADTAVLQAQVQRLLATPDARTRLTAFARQWLGYDRWAPGWSTAFLDGVSPSGVKEDAVTELDALFAALMLDTPSPASALLTSTQTQPVSAALAPIYGVAPGATTLPASRAGVLTRVGMLSTGGDDWHVVARGLTVAQKLLCRPISPPTFSVAAAAMQAESLKVSNAQRIASVTNSSACQGCHATINALGSARSDFDSLGREVTIEKHYAGGQLDFQVPVDASADLTKALGEAITVDGTQQLENALANDPEFQQCWATQFVRYTLGRNEASDACLAESGSTALLDGGTMLDAVRALYASPELTVWRE
jgi:hypothetical protein